jgi:F-type H+-transporting ATPase subunit b
MESCMTATIGGIRIFLLAEEGKFNPIDIGDWPLFFWTALVFVLLLTILSTKVWRPLMATIAKREDSIREDIQKAEEARQEAEAIREKHRREMEVAAQQAKALLDEARDRASLLSVDLERRARENAEQILTKARQQIEADKVLAMQQIRDQVVDLSVAITKQILHRSTDREDHLKVAETLIPKVGQPS